MELAEFLGASIYSFTIKDKDLLEFYEEMKSDLQINPYMFKYLHQYCIRILSCFKKETLDLKPESTCKINWEYVDGIPEMEDKYKVALPETNYWICKKNEYAIF